MAELKQVFDLEERPDAGGHLSLHVHEVMYGTVY